MMKLLHLFMDEITMDPLHAVYLTVGLFVITFFNPGANLFVVVQTSLASGRRAGVLTGLGVALGDAFYSGLGLFGLATLITQCEEIFSLIRIVGGAYLLWFAWCSQAFSLPAVRRAYGRMQRVASRVIGAIIGVFALRLIYEGVTQR
ncbi:MAG: LysE family transporter [Escherichia coli]|nr:LysE family transporter [Escherichia coli]